MLVKKYFFFFKLTLFILDKLDHILLDISECFNFLD